MQESLKKTRETRPSSLQRTHAAILGLIVEMEIKVQGLIMLRLVSSPVYLQEL